MTDKMWLCRKCKEPIGRICRSEKNEIYLRAEINGKVYKWHRGEITCQACGWRQRWHSPPEWFDWDEFHHLT